MEDLLKEQQRTNELLEKLITQDKDPNELLTVEQIHKEFDKITSTTLYNTI